MSRLPNAEPEPRTAVIVRIPKTLDREIEIWCAGAGWTKQRFIETAARELLKKKRHA